MHLRALQEYHRSRGTRKRAKVKEVLDESAACVLSEYDIRPAELRQEIESSVRGWESCNLNWPFSRHLAEIVERGSLHRTDLRCYDESGYTITVLFSLVFPRLHESLHLLHAECTLCEAVWALACG